MTVTNVLLGALVALAAVLVALMLQGSLSPLLVLVAAVLVLGVLLSLTVLYPSQVPYALKLLVLVFFVVACVLLAAVLFARLGMPVPGA